VRNGVATNRNRDAIGPDRAAFGILCRPVVIISILCRPIVIVKLESPV